MTFRTVEHCNIAHYYIISLENSKSGWAQKRWVYCAMGINSKSSSESAGWNWPTMYSTRSIGFDFELSDLEARNEKSYLPRAIQGPFTVQTDIFSSQEPMSHVVLEGPILNGLWDVTLHVIHEVDTTVQYGMSGLNLIVPWRFYWISHFSLRSCWWRKSNDGLTICLSLRPLMFRRVSIFNVVDFGIVTVAHSSTALTKCGASSAPLAYNMHSIFPRGWFAFFAATKLKQRAAVINDSKLKRIWKRLCERHKN